MLPPSLADALRPELPGLADAVVRAIGREVPDYARPLEGPFGDAVRTGVELALSGFVDSLAEPGALEQRDRAASVALGRGEHRGGRSLNALQSAYRVGARMSWDTFSRAATEAGQPPDVIYALAGAIFSYIDAISAESVEGWTREQSVRASERADRRRALALLLARGDARPAELADLAALAAWPLPQRVAALVIAPGADVDPGRFAGRLGPEVLVGEDAGGTVAWLPDPDGPGRRAALIAAVGALPAVLGPSASPEAGHRSLARALVALRARHPGSGLAEHGLLVADEHRAALLLHGADPALAADLADAALAPLDALGGASRERLLETLRAWLDHPGQATRVAEVLHVHPQTVRYRVGRLRELLGDRLDEDEGRFELALALRIRG